MNDRGGINILVIPLVFVILLFCGAAAFGVWAYASREDYRTNVQAKVEVAVKSAKQAESARKDLEHAEVDKLPLDTYVGPEQYGGVHVQYPKNWSGYVTETGGSNQPLDGFFQPGVVPSITDQTSIFALRFQVVNKSYASTLKAYEGGVANKTITAAPYAFPKVPSVVGIRYEGAIVPSKKISGSMVIVPIRDKALVIWTESQIYRGDFDRNVLPNVTFSP